MAYIRCIGGSGGGGGNTPEGYIYNANKCAFNTGHVHTENTKIIMKAHLFESPDMTGGYMAAWGARKGSFGTNAFGFFSRFADQKFCFYRTSQEASGHKFNEAESNTDAPFYQTPVILTAEGKTATWQNVDTLVSKSLTASNANVNGGVAPLGIFCHNNSGDANGWSPVDYAYMKLYYFEIYESGVLEHRFVPAYNNNQFCLYDEVDQTYIYDTFNSGASVRGYIPN